MVTGTNQASGPVFVKVSNKLLLPSLILLEALNFTSYQLFKNVT